MFYLVSGGSGSGKSAYAEKIIAEKAESRRYYIATMECADEESKRRIARHQKMRADKNFETIECPRNLADVSLPEGSAALLECMSNLVANELFRKDSFSDPGETEERILEGVQKLALTSDLLVIVTNEVFSDGMEFDEWTQKYISCLGNINRRMAELADKVVEVVYSIPIVIKEKI